MTSHHHRKNIMEDEYLILFIRVCIAVMIVPISILMYSTYVYCILYDWEELPEMTLAIFVLTMAWIVVLDINFLMLVEKYGDFFDKRYKLFVIRRRLRRCKMTQNMAAIKIQRQWKICISNPDFTMCKNRLLNEFESLYMTDQLFERE